MTKLTSKLIWIPIVCLLSGCMLFQSPQRPGYQAGRTTAFVWMATEGVKPDNLQNAGETGYRILQAVYVGEEGIDPSERQKAAERATRAFLGSNATEAQTKLVMNFFNMASSRLENEITDQATRITVLANFTTGIQDALEDWQ